MNKEWEYASEPKGRPVSLERRLFIVGHIKFLAAPRPRMMVNSQTGNAILKPEPPIMSRTQALKVLMGKFPEDESELKTRGGKRLPFGGWSIEQLRDYHK